MAHYESVQVHYHGRLIDVHLRYGVHEHGYWKVVKGKPLHWTFRDFVEVDKIAERELVRMYGHNYGYMWFCQTSRPDYLRDENPRGYPRHRQEPLPQNRWDDSHGKEGYESDYE